MEYASAKEFFIETTLKAQHLASAAGLLYWDSQTIMPKKGGAARGQVMAAVLQEVFNLETSDAYAGAMQTLLEHTDRLSTVEQRMVEEAWRSYSRGKKIPADLYEAYNVAAAESGQVWADAKQKGDFEAFRPHLQKMIDYSRQFAECWGYAATPYDALLEEYDPALLCAQPDPVFEKLLGGTRSLLARVGENTPLPAVTMPAHRQAAVGDYLLQEIGFDLDAGNLFITEHPFTVEVHPGDIRVTTQYYDNIPLSSIFSVLHEGGHGVYGQNIDPQLNGTNLYGGASIGLHESQSRLFENIIGRSRGFWRHRLEAVNRLFGSPLATDPELFYKGINAVQPSLIRTEADELTYNLHIIIRYQCEKAIFNEGLNAAALPELWREKYREYLGVAPENHTEGLLQDSHWSAGSFGYFPSYTIGNLCAAQFAAAYEKQHGPMEENCSTFEGMAGIVFWLRDNIHKYGQLKKPRQIMQDVCGEAVNPDCFLQYMEKKLATVYPGF